MIQLFRLIDNAIIRYARTRPRLGNFLLGFERGFLTPLFCVAMLVAMVLMLPLRCGLWSINLVVDGPESARRVWEHTS
jgi:hypothetical protein